MKMMIISLTILASLTAVASETYVGTDAQGNACEIQVEQQKEGNFKFTIPNYKETLDDYNERSKFWEMRDLVFLDEVDQGIITGKAKSVQTHEFGNRTKTTQDEIIVLLDGGKPISYQVNSSTKIKSYRTMNQRLQGENPLKPLWVDIKIMFAIPDFDKYKSSLTCKF